MVERKQ